MPKFPVLCDSGEYLRRGHPSPFPANLLPDVADSFGVRVARMREDVRQLADKVLCLGLWDDANNSAVRLLVRTLCT